MNYDTKKAELLKEAETLNKQGQQHQQSLQQIATRIEQIKGQLQLIEELTNENTGVDTADTGDSIPKVD